MSYDPIVQEAGIIIPLIIAVGLALLSALLFRPKNPGLGPEAAPNTATERGAFVPLVIGQRRVGAVVLWVGDRLVREEEIPGAGGGGGIFGSLFGGGAPKQRIYYEKSIHALCVGPATEIRSIYVDGELLENSTAINNIDFPSGTSITFGKHTARIYWGTLTHPSTDALLPQKLGIASNGPYVMRVEWDFFRLGTQARWPNIEYVIRVNCTDSDAIVNQPNIGIGNINPASAFLQLFTAKFPHGGGMPSDWLDYQSVTDFGDLAETEGVGMNMISRNGDSAEKAIGDIMADMSVVIPECNGVLSLYPIRQITDPVQVLDNDITQPPIEEIEKLHISPLGDALIYEYTDREHGYTNATIDVDDDSMAAVRNQRKTKKIPMKTITDREVASIVAARRQVEDLNTATGIKLKGLRGLRTALPGQAFDLPGIGRVRLISYKPLWNDPTVEMDLLIDPFDQAPIAFVDPSIPGGQIDDVLGPDIRFDAYELPYIALPGQNGLILFRHRVNQSIFFSLVHVSPDGTNYTLIDSQNTPSAGGVLESDFNPVIHMPMIEEGPVILIDDNGDETLPINLSAATSDWISGSQIMMIGRDARAELFYVREWEVVIPDVSYRPKGLVRARFNMGVATPRYYDESMYRNFFAGEACYIISSFDVRTLTGGIITTGGVTAVKSQPGNLRGTMNLASIAPDTLIQQSLGVTTPPLAWFVCGGDFHPDGPLTTRGRRDLTYEARFIQIELGQQIEEGIVFEFAPSTKGNGAGLQGAGQAVEPVPITGTFIIEMWSGPGQSTEFKDLELSGFRTAEMTSLLVLDAQGASTGVYAFHYTRQMLIDDFFGDASDLRTLQPSDRNEDLAHWKFLLYHLDGTLSPSVELRPHAIEINANEWIPLAQLSI